MPRKPVSKLAPRNTPQQARSRELVQSILIAAIRVLERDGAGQLTTIRVAERAGVSVGSLYQYFPNKESILLRLQEDEWRQTGEMLEAIVGNERLSPEARIRRTFRAFFRSELGADPTLLHSSIQLRSRRADIRPRSLVASSRHA
jgi:AcrR family transcriptional regulator